jgi:hypothetical protein
MEGGAVLRTLVEGLLLHDAGDHSRQGFVAWHHIQDLLARNGVGEVDFLHETAAAGLQWSRWTECWRELSSLCSTLSAAIPVFYTYWKEMNWCCGRHGTLIPKWSAD